MILFDWENGDSIMVRRDQIRCATVHGSDVNVYLLGGTKFSVSKAAWGWMVAEFEPLKMTEAAIEDDD